MLAEIITIGDELLIGQVVDTNSAWIAVKLNEAGIRVKQITSVSDDRGHILQALKAAKGRAALVILTGGLGPTKDDITKNTLAGYFHVGFKRHEETLDHVRKIFERYQRPMLEMNEKQADVPENCTPLLNRNGTAPGMWFEEEGTIYVSLPGVPHEMMYLMEEEVLPRLEGKAGSQRIIHRTLLTSGIGESFLAGQIADIEDALPPHIRLAYLPKLGQVRLRLSGRGTDEELLKKEIADHFEHIKNRVGNEFVITDEDKPLEKVILDLLDSRGQTLTVAESCTGGFISQQISQHPGCSSVFLGGAISYAYAMKESMLGVKHETLEKFGAVSEETVTEMAEGALRNYGSDYAIAVSGIAGPGGALPGKPVGTVWIAVAGKAKTESRKFTFSGRRAQHIERSAVSAFTMLLKLIREGN
jgi:nicotinamide-nucleotide amidase